jgi:quercetin dioxygenase-like cupin family protein
MAARTREEKPMSIFHPSDDREFVLEGNHMVGLATRSRNAETVEVWRTRMEAGSATPPHQHDYEEVVVVLSGRGRARIADQEIAFEAGDTLILPAGKVHQIFSETASESIAVLPRCSTIRTASGEVTNLPWRH